MNGDGEIALLLLRGGADPQGVYGPFPYGGAQGNALYAVLRTCRSSFGVHESELVRELIDRGIHADQGDKSEWTALYYAQRYKKYYPSAVLRDLQDSVPQEKRDALVALANEDRRISFKEDMTYNLQMTGFPLLAMATLIGSSIFCREMIYSDNPSANGMATFNAVLTGAMTGGLAAGFIGFQFDRAHASQSYGTGAPGLTLPVFTILFALGGMGAGAFLPAIPSASDAFHQNRFLYYVPSAVSLGLSARLVYTVWF
jgi:hypothetical protein